MPKKEVYLFSGQELIFNKYKVKFRLIKKHHDYFTLVPYLDGMRAITVKADLIRFALKNKDFSINKLI